MSAPDKNFHSIAGETVGQRYVGSLVPPDDSYADTLKLSRARDGAITADLVVGGREDCVDVNNLSERVFIHAQRWEPRGKYVATIKGGSSTISLSGEIHGHGSEVDVDLGNWSDQSSEITRNTKLNLTTADGSPITVRLLLAERPRLLNADVQRYRFVFPSQIPLCLRRLGFLIWKWLRKVGVAVCFLLPLLLAAGCITPKPQKGGGVTTTLGGGEAASVTNIQGPDNPKTPTRQTIEKTTEREFIPQPAASPSAPRTSSDALAQAAAQAMPHVAALLRETISEKSTVELGVAQKDTARELGARLANMRGVMWVGVLLLIGGPVVGIKMGWLTNGLIAGAVGLLLIILSTVIPGNEAWFGLAGLLILPLVGYVYYRSQYDANKDGVPDRLQRGATPTSST